MMPFSISPNLAAATEYGATDAALYNDAPLIVGGGTAGALYGGGQEATGSAAATAAAGLSDMLPSNWLLYVGLAFAALLAVKILKKP